MKITQFLSVLLLAGTFVGCSAAVEVGVAKNGGSKLPIGVVNISEILPVMGECPATTISIDIQDEDAEMQKELDRRGNEIETKQATLKKKTEELKKAGKNDEAAVTALMNLESEIKIDYQKYQARVKELSAQMQEKVQEVYKKISEISQAVAKDMGLSLVLPGPVLYVDAKYDITKEVADRLNNKYRAEKRAKMLAKPTSAIKPGPVAGPVAGPVTA